MVKKILLFLSLFVLILNINAQELLPKSGGEIYKKTYYTISYSEKNEQANWVYYYLTPSMIKGKTKRSNRFKADKCISTQSASLKDYKASGYDRGHLCPAAAMRVNSISMKESFLMSNMSPQKPGFNRGLWKRLEAQVRKWVLKNGNLYVVSGPIFKDCLGAIGPNKVTIPGYYYKVIYSKDRSKMIAFVMPNKKIKGPISKYVVTVNKVEKLTGIDFFYLLDDNKEERLESHSVLSKWIWK